MLTDANQRAHVTGRAARPADKATETDEIHVKRERPPLGDHTLERTERLAGIPRVTYDAEPPEHAVDMRVYGHHLSPELEECHTGRGLGTHSLETL